MKQILNHTLIIAALFLSIATTAEARTRRYSEDMFYDIGVIYDRPSVPSDKYRKADVFPQVPLLSNKKKDMFDKARRINIFGREDMFRTRHVTQIPVYLLKIDN